MASNNFLGDKLQKNIECIKTVYGHNLNMVYPQKVKNPVTEIIQGVQDREKYFDITV